ncbi:MAG: hypothetical protein LBS81_04720 [Endomicrobium sp.]|jgi:hypothetical protein|nr:hypothetical protein [Endomicrobium sp.]
MFCPDADDPAPVLLFSKVILQFSVLEKTISAPELIYTAPLELAAGLFANVVAELKCILTVPLPEAVPSFSFKIPDAYTAPTVSAVLLENNTEP